MFLTYSYTIAWKDTKKLRSWAYLWLQNKLNFSPQNAMRIFNAQTKEVPFQPKTFLPEAAEQPPAQTIVSEQAVANRKLV